MKANKKRRARKARYRALYPAPKPQGTAEYLNDDPETGIVVLKDPRGNMKALMPEQVYFDILKLPKTDL